jgi:hypothetical protein
MHPNVKTTPNKYRQKSRWQRGCLNERQGYNIQHDEGFLTGVGPRLISIYGRNSSLPLRVGSAGKLLKEFYAAAKVSEK